MIPASFTKAGYITADAVRKQRRVLIGTDGPPDSGKTEFALSAPGPGMVICLDRGLDGVLHNPHPPATRNPDFVFKTIQVPKVNLASQEVAITYWKDFKKELYGAIDNSEARTIVLDGDSDSWELQRFAEFGRIAKVPGHLYDGVNSVRRGIIARMYDAKKIVIATNRVRKQFIQDPNKTEESRVWSGQYERQGFADQDYLWTIQLRHFYDEEAKEFGVRIMKCKPDKDLVGLELRGDECNFETLIQTVYPMIPLAEWGL